MTPEQHKQVIEALQMALRDAETDNDHDVYADAIAIMEADHIVSVNNMVPPVPSDAVLMRQALGALEDELCHGPLIKNAHDAIAALRARLGDV